MDRRRFIRNTLGASAAPIGLGYVPSGAGQEPSSLLEAMVWANDRAVHTQLDGYQRLLQDAAGNRERSGFLLAAASAYGAAASRYHQHEHLIGPMEEVATALQQRQYRDGTFDVGNLQSPPDTAFMIEQLGRAQTLLQRQGHDATATVRASLQEILLQAGEALTTGGVHTPNHRWAVCAALAWMHHLYPDAQYVNRIDTWLSEGIDQGVDGQYSERSPNYSAHVVNPALLDLAVLLDRPELLDYVRKNLEMTIYHTDRNGEVETVASRRQDQAQAYRVHIHAYYRPYRHLAIADENPRFARVAKNIESESIDRLGSYLPDFLLFDTLTEPLPAPESLPRDYEMHFPNSGLVRIRRAETTATVFGGSDWHLGHGVWSGLSHNPTFFRFCKGAAILESIRLAPDFFSTGYFRSNGLRVEGNGYHLQEERRVPYHLPLPEAHRREDGDYEMSPDGRFFSKMSFADRPKEYKTLRTRVVVREAPRSGVFEIAVSIDQHPQVDVAIELCFRKGGQLTGIMPKEGDADGYFLNEGRGAYQVGDDRIEFGPGVLAHSGFTMHGEQYDVHNGGIQLQGHRVYIMGTTPFEHTVRIA